MCRCLRTENALLTVDVAARWGTRTWFCTSVPEEGVPPNCGRIGVVGPVGLPPDPPAVLKRKPLRSEVGRPRRKATGPPEGRRVQTCCIADDRIAGTAMVAANLKVLPTTRKGRVSPSIANSEDCSGRLPDWIKVKTPNAPAATRGSENLATRKGGSMYRPVHH